MRVLQLRKREGILELMVLRASRWLRFLVLSMRLEVRMELRAS